MPPTNSYQLHQPRVVDITMSSPLNTPRTAFSLKMRVVYYRSFNTLFVAYCLLHEFHRTRRHRYICTGCSLRRRRDHLRRVFTRPHHLSSNSSLHTLFPRDLLSDRRLFDRSIVRLTGNSTGSSRISDVHPGPQNGALGVLLGNGH